jgi:hypothetical protein
MVKELVKNLSVGKHDVTICGRDESCNEIEERLTDIKYIHIMFPNTEGGTELGISVDTKSCDLTKVNFKEGKGQIHVEGTTNLNYHDVRCIADIDLESRKGKGYLIMLDN